MTKAAKLAQAATAAAEVRAHQTNPDVIALRVEKTRALVDRLVWSGIIAGLLFTMANVQSFASHGAKQGSIEWVIAWLLDPMVSLVLIGVLKGEQVINRAGLKTGAWVRITKWVALGCTYGMNTWSAYAAGSPAKILLHSVPPLIVVCATEAITDLRLLITKAVDTAYRAASSVSDTAPKGVSDTATDTSRNTTRPVSAPVSKPVPNTMLDTPPDTTADTTRPVSNTPADTVSNTGGNTGSDTEDVHDYLRRMAEQERARKAEEEAKKPRKQPTGKKSGKGKKRSREEVAREIYDAHMAEHHEVISNAELRRQLGEAGHPTGNRTAADLLVEFKAHPLHIAS